MSTKTCNICETVQHSTKVTVTDYYKVAYMFLIGTKINDLDDLEWLKRTLAEKMRFMEHTRKISMKIDPYYHRHKCTSMILVSTSMIYM